MGVYEWAIVFDRAGRQVTFWRYEQGESEAVESACHGFQAAYGYWPSAPTQVVQTRWVPFGVLDRSGA